MKMWIAVERSGALVLPLLLLLLACNNADRKEAAPETSFVDTVHIDTIDSSDQYRPTAPVSTSSGIFARMKRLDPRFTEGAMNNFVGVGTFDSVNTQQIDPTALRAWLPFLSVNADSTYAIDPYTYGYALEERPGGRIELVEVGEADMEIALIDLNSGRRSRLFFAGPGTVDLDLRWVNPRLVQLITAEVLDNDRYRPTAHRFQVAEWRHYTSPYPDTLRGLRQLLQTARTRRIY